MMLKNEEKIIERALESCENLIDSYFICDTGSEDGTQDKIRSFMKKRNIPGEVVQIEWKNFGYSKSIMMKKARESCKADYFLFMDGREIVQTENGKKPEKEDKLKLLDLLKDNETSVFLLNTLDGGSVYRRWNFFKNNQLYIWKSPIHEYIQSTKKGSITSNFDFLQIVKKGWGNSGCGSEKYMNYAKVLEEFVEENPNSHRETYYVAQSYKDAGKMELAIPWYKKRIEMDHKDEYVFISMLTLFRYYKNRDEKEALHYLFQMKKNWGQRLEGLYEGMMYFKDNDNDTAYSFGKRGLQTIKSGYISNLFLEKSIYDYLFLFNFSIVAHNSNNPLDALTAAEMIKIKMPINFENQHKININFYKQKLEESKKVIPYINNKIQNLHPNIVIIDNVLKDPDARREFALKQDFNVKGNFPCCRTKHFATDEDKKMLEKILGTKITYWPESYNGSYQYATKNDKSWIHRDTTEYSAILFLTPDPLITAGTETFMHKRLKKTYGEGEICNEMSKDSYDKTKWDTLDSIGCLYNRLIVFNGMQSHQSRDYFGDDKMNGRLFQVFFFNIHREYPFKKYP